MIGINAPNAVVSLKRKDGSLPKGTILRTPPLMKMKDEEDACFIFFNVGSLVLYDHR